MENVYAAADLVLLTSDNEGMPVTLIEAALAGLPAVATAVGSTGEVVLNRITGLMVPPDVVSLVDASRALLSDPVRRGELGEAARTRAEDVFSVERMTADHMTLYRTLLAGPRARRIRRRPRARP
jgi:glycosyltransferase involved in cell wall biosynthesis